MEGNDLTHGENRNLEYEVLIETVSGKLAYNITDDISFASNDNTFVFKNTADINIKSEATIDFLPGFKVEEGAKLSHRRNSSNYVEFIQKVENGVYSQ